MGFDDSSRIINGEAERGEYGNEEEGKRKETRRDAAQMNGPCGQVFD